jgi:hypothetical protein
MAAVGTPNLQHEEQGISPREYAAKEGISLQTAYTRCWRGQVPCRQILGKYWVIYVAKEAEQQR